MIEFHDREKEIEEIMRILNSRPDLITFVYGPINSGKTELFRHVIKMLPEKFKPFYVNLRGVYIDKAEDFLTVLFDVEEKEYNVREFVRILANHLPESIDLPLLGRIPVPKNLFKKFFEERGFDNAFKYIETLFTELSKQYTPIFVIDELQVIGDLKINGLLIYKFFNLLIHLTKELHTCHVFAITSDSLFIEKVFNEAMLHGRCRYLLVDDFDYETTKGFLKKHGFSEEEIELAWNYLGGKPVYLVEAVKERDRLKEFCEEQLKLRYSQILDTIYEIEKNEKLFNEVLELFRTISEKEVMRYAKIDDALKFCIRKNILFLEPVNRIVKPQSQLDLLAIRRILKEIG